MNVWNSIPGKFWYGSWQYASENMELYALSASPSDCKRFGIQVEEFAPLIALCEAGYLPGYNSVINNWTLYTGVKLNDGSGEAYAEIHSDYTVS